METKLLKISEDNSRSLTFEQAYIQYGPLVKSKAYGWNRYEFDEMFQLAAIALWEAYCFYDASLYEVTFGYLAGKFIDNKLLSHYAKQKRRAKIVSFVSLNAPVSDEDDATELGELIGEEETYTADVVNKIVIDGLLDRLPKKQKSDVQHVLDGFRRKEIVEITSQSQPIVYKRIKAALRRLEKMYVQEVEAL